MKTTATLAWATSAFAFSTGGVRWASPQGEAIDAVLCLVVGGGAAYLALALRQRVPAALAACQRIAFVSGVANGVMLPLAIAACWRFGGDATAHVAASRIALAASIALLATATPWVVYRSLRAPQVRAWFGVASPATTGGR